MTHFKNDSSRAEATPAEWLTVGAQIGALTNQWAERYDVVAYVGPGAGGGVAPACYNPALAEIEVDVSIAFGKSVTPETIGDMTKREVQFDWPRASGVIFHEALHARYSRWNLAKAATDLEPLEFKALVLLEEGRIESFGTSVIPENRGFLRACALEIVLADLRETGVDISSMWTAAHVAALTSARVDAGSLEFDDVETLEGVLIKKLGSELFGKLRDLWMQAQDFAGHDSIEGLYPVAREFAKLVKDAAEEAGEPEPGHDETTLDESGSLGEFGGELRDALDEAAGSAAIGGAGDVADQQSQEEWEREVENRSSSSKRTKENRATADSVFGKGTGPEVSNETNSRLVERRAPRGDERAAAVKVAQMLEKAKYRDRDETEISSIVPPGRLRTRAMVQGAALKSKGVMTQVEPWRRTKRTHTEDPTLTVGVMVDISGSMSSAMEPMAVTAWVMSEAVRRVQGRAAMVYYGTGVFPTLKPGQHLSEVTVYSAPDGTERFDKAFKALDGSLNLLNGNGARLLVIVSDLCYTSEETKNTRRWLDECEKHGVGVMVVSPIASNDARRIAKSSSKSVQLVEEIRSAADVATQIGAAAAKALESVQR
jgi:hypothetical protein